MKSEQKELKTNEAGICKGFCRSAYRFQETRCSFKIWKDGYCKVHHPEERRRKQIERNDKKHELFLASERRLKEELLPCPFCGHTPTVEFRPSRRGQPAEAWLWHAKQVCPVSVSIRRHCTTKEQVIKLWNSRAEG